jgi:superfamily I DNA/RNA helicase
MAQDMLHGGGTKKMRTDEGATKQGRAALFDTLCSKQQQVVEGEDAQQNEEGDAEDEELKPRKLLKFIHTAKNGGFAYDEYENPFKFIMRRYQERMKAANAVDFDDMMQLTTSLFNDHPEVLAKVYAR